MRHRSSVRDPDGRAGRAVAVVSVALVGLSAGLLLAVLHRLPPTTGADGGQAGPQVARAPAGVPYDGPRVRPSSSPGTDVSGRAVADVQGRREGDLPRGVDVQGRREGDLPRGVDVQGRREVDLPRRADVQGRREGERHWRAVLAELDRRRAAAYAAADPALLARVYVARSPPIRSDRALLRRYRHRGLRVVGMRMRVIDLRVRARRRGHVVVVVRERLAHATVRGATTRRLADDVDQHRLTLRRVTGRGWRIASARPVAS